MADGSPATVLRRVRRERLGLRLPRVKPGMALSMVVLLGGAALSLLPFLWMISTSLMSLGEAIGGRLFPTELHFENYVDAWSGAEFSHFMINSVLITVITLSGEMVCSIMAAYAFARMQFPGRNLIFGLLLSTLMIPVMVTMIPNLLTVTWLGRVGPIPWIDNWPSLTVPFMGSVFSIFLLRQFFAQIPDELFDAARIDGAGHLRILVQLVLPLSIVECPRLAAAGDELRPLAADLGRPVQFRDGRRQQAAPDHGRRLHHDRPDSGPILPDPKAVHRQYRPDRPQGMRRTAARASPNRRADQRR
jgi:ABC-type glycerol-3-phosphate transport system permease component